MLISERIRKEQFIVGWCGLFVNPFYFARRGLYQSIKDFAPYLSGSILDVGCGSKPYKRIIACREYIGLEVESAMRRDSTEADAYYDGKSLPFPAERFDSVVTSQVLEHIFEPEIFLSEIHRVLKSGGHLLLTVPFIWDEHEQPIDYARYTSFGVVYLLRQRGFTIVDLKKSTCDGRLFFQLLNECIYKRTLCLPNVYRLPVVMALTSIINLLGITLWWIFPRNMDLYLDNVVLARKERLR